MSGSPDRNAVYNLYVCTKWSYWMKVTRLMRSQARVEGVPSKGMRPSANQRDRGGRCAKHRSGSRRTTENQAQAAALRFAQVAAGVRGLRTPQEAAVRCWCALQGALLSQLTCSIL